MRRWLQPVLFRSRGLATLLVLPRLARAKRWGVSLLGAAGAVAYPEVAPDDEEVWVVATALAASRLEATPKTPTAGIAAGDCRRGR